MWELQLLALEPDPLLLREHPPLEPALSARLPQRL